MEHRMNLRGGIPSIRSGVYACWRWAVKNVSLASGGAW
jgi:hypothetical protein